jgi:predicted nucleic acid-binding protein
MNDVFLDTAYLIALFNARDEWHARAKGIAPSITGRSVTTAWVLTELIDGFRHPSKRAKVMEFLEDMEADDRFITVPPTEELFRAGLRFFEKRPDQEWSLTDCISFVVMERKGLRDAATTDHHFEQAGFNVLLK